MGGGGQTVFAVATALAQLLGQHVSANSITLAVGSAASPAIRIGAATTGLYSSSAGTILDVAVSGGQVARVSSNGFFMVGAAAQFQVSSGGFFGFSSGTAGATPSDIFLARDAAGVLAQRNGVNAQALRVYGTYTDASNYERVEVYSNSSEGFVGHAGLGTGMTRNFAVGGAQVILRSGGTNRFIVDASGHFIAAIDNGYDIGRDGANRPRNVYVAGVVSVGQNIYNATGGAYCWGTTRSIMKSPADGIITLLDSNQTTFTRLQFGGTTAASPAIGRSGNALSVQFADASDTAGLSASIFVSTGGGLASNALLRGVGLQIGSTNVIQWSSTTAYNGTPDLIITRDAANVLAQRNGGTAQAFRVYNTYTDALNYERAFARWASNVFEIGAEGAGTGSARTVRIISSSGSLELNDGNSTARLTSGIFLMGGRSITQLRGLSFEIDNTYDIGQPSANRARNLHVGTDGTFGGSVTVGNKLGVGVAISATAFAIFAPGTTAVSSMRILAGVAPTSPVNGDIWFDGTDIKMRIGGATKTFTLT